MGAMDEFASTTDPTQQATLARLAQLLKDPVAGPEIMKIVNSPNTSMAGIVGNTGKMMSNAKTPSAALGAGIGGVLGAGITALRQRSAANQLHNQQVAGQYAAGQAGPPSLTPNDTDPSEAENLVGDYLVGDDQAGEDFKRGGKVKRKFASGGELDEPAAKPARSVLHRRPIISTTIVIAKKPPASEKKSGVRKKPPASEKKARGGAIKADALPPRRGPGDGKPPSPFKRGGRVQVPRGSGVAQRGKKFSGIF